MKLSDRLRPAVECAPWVIEEVKKLEVDAAVNMRVELFYAAMDRIANLEHALYKANSILSELTFTDWIKGSDTASADMRQRISNIHAIASNALKKDLDSK